MQRVVSVRAIEGYRLEVEFDDRTRGVVSLEDRLFGPVFEPLRDRALFEQVFVDEFGAVCWPNGADLAPDGLYSRIHGQTRPHVKGVGSLFRNTTVQSVGWDGSPTLAFLPTFGERGASAPAYL
jgi:hypothetical protein